MVEWILSLAGMAFLGVLVETLIPNGKLNKFIKSIFSLFLLFITIKPIPKLFNININFKDKYEFENDLNFIQSINEKKIENYKLIIIKKLNEKGIFNVELQFETDITKSDLIIKKVYVDISKIVLKNEDKHINILDSILIIVTDTLKIKDEEVVIYGS